ncbi:MAG: Mini-ribonuclease 3 [Symploca sp. SIO1C4]|uniref:Mini-ribonuclease 3 n=1 Tax=Symploca sp. SIO1C4 TaxID=2607765 RepID=A0A6B3NGM5_9CYAN|nr:Mini-ribonuclease 3 [Symploca sp. SIO1C4]
MRSKEEESSEFSGTESALCWAQVRFSQLSAAVNSLSQLQQISPASLAYLGDAVYELYIRSCYLLPPKRLKDYHQQVVAQVRAESQAKILQLLEPHLTEPELEILRRGRNAATTNPRRLDPKIYQQASSLETLIGYLYLTNPQRLTKLLAYLELNPSSKVIKS